MRKANSKKTCRYRQLRMGCRKSQQLG